MQNQNSITQHSQATAIERVLIQGDLSALTEIQRLLYYRKLCDSLGLNYLATPFAYIKLQGKLTLYAKRECTEQLRKIHSISVQIISRELLEDIYVVTTRATLPDGRCDESIGAVHLGQTQGESRANLIMKAETKGKRRVTLSLCGMAFLDQSEVDSIPGAQVIEVQPTGEVWRTWTNTHDAIAWAKSVLPQMPMEEIEQRLLDLPATNGKKAPQWCEHVLKLAKDEF